MTCECGGIFLVIRVDENRSDRRLCDVECSSCGEVRYSQPYDFGSPLNIVKNTNQR